MVGGSLEFIFHKGVAAQLYQLGWRNKWPLHTWGCRLHTPPDQYKKTFYLQLRVCVSYLDVSSNERFLASLGCLLKYLSLRSCSSQRDQSPTYCILEFIHYSSQVVTVLSLFAKSPRYLCNRIPQQTTPPLTLGGNSEQHQRTAPPGVLNPPLVTSEFTASCPLPPSPSLFQNTWLCKLGINKDKRDPVLYIYSDNLGKSYNNIICITQLQGLERVSQWQRG